MTPVADGARRIVVLGGGFAGLETIRCLERGLRRHRDLEIILVSDQNYLLFTPLLPQVASSLVEPRHIIQPIRDIRGFRRRFRFRRDPFWNALHLAKLVGIRKQIQVAVDWSLARLFPRDSAIMRAAPHCPVCRALATRRDAAA